MKFAKKVLIFIFLLGLLLVPIAKADTLQDIQNKIQEYTQKLTQLGEQSTTLQNQIAQFDAQIYLTTLKIQETEERIKLLGGRIDQLEVSLTALSNAFSQRAVETYKMARVGDPVILLISAPNLGEAVSRFHYLEKIQEADRDLLQKLQVAQNNYKVERTDQETLQATLTQQKADLNTQKAAKANLLTITKNDEARYQALLAQALAEQSAIEGALAAGVKVGPVKAGDVIGLIGNSGYPWCSTGKHLHFEIRKDGNWTDPVAYLQNKTVFNGQDGSGNVAIGSGNWPWPISDSIEITQFYGKTPYSWKYSYSGGIHTGLDMISSSSDLIRAPADGTLFKSAQSCGSSTINIVYIDHGGGLISLYLHVQ